MMINNFEELNKPCHKIIDSTQPQCGNLYLGGYNATKKETLENLKINAVLTAARDTGLYFKDRQHLIIEALDDEDYQLDRHFRKSIDFIDKNISTTNVLVHCFAGVSRSVTIVAAYLMVKRKMKAADAIKYIQSIRQIAGPNEGFKQQLEKFEKKL